MKPTLTIRGFEIFKGFLDRDAQLAVVEDLRGVARQAPMFTPVMPQGRPMSVRMTSAGDLGWVSDKRGYRYQTKHPNGAGWPGIPQRLLDIWMSVANASRLPDSCLVNYYGEGARMGLHQDRDEADLTQPVVSISLGDTALFRMGSDQKGGSTESIWLESGDVVVLQGAARLAYHGIDRIRFQSSSLLPAAGRINITMRVAG